VLEEVAKILQQYPTLKIQIGGHTDDRGSAELNDTLSTSRAASVLDHMKQNFPQISWSQFTSRGYGSSQPIAPNRTELGRAKNRRVEFKVLNTDALRIEREKRRFLRKDEGVKPAPAPGDSTKS
jgi:outer membrane protein OmpA-like peptidoglycan-associated protein